MINLKGVTGITDAEKDVLSRIYMYATIYYSKFDKGHDLLHLNTVVNNAIKIREMLPYRDSINPMTLITAAMYHDIGLVKGRIGHHNESAKMAKKCLMLKSYFSEEDIRRIANACKEHRSSSKYKHSSTVSMIVADADSLNNIETMIYRSFQYNGGKEGCLEAVYHHLANEKYGRSGYHKFILKEAQDIYENEYNIYEYLEDKDMFIKVYKKVTGYDN